MVSKKRRQHSEEGNVDRWLITYADMITLLMAFFVMLYSMSQIDLKKFAAMAGSVRAELGGTGLLTGSSGVAAASATGPTVLGIAPSFAYQVTGKLREATERSLRDVARQTGIEVVSSGEDIVVRIPTSELFFALGSAELTSAMLKVLQRLVKVIRGQQCTVKVEGHTCDLPIRSARYPSNWELSADRARNIALYFAKDGGVPPERLSFMGFADTRPLVPNTTEAQRRRNRRVEITLHPTSLPAPPAPPAPAPAAAPVTPAPPAPPAPAPPAPVPPPPPGKSGAPPMVPPDVAPSPINLGPPKVDLLQPVTPKAGFVGSEAQTSPLEEEKH
jgi:chemotaxis protein MotB